MCIAVCIILKYIWFFSNCKGKRIYSYIWDYKWEKDLKPVIQFSPLMMHDL